jgi:hypothetical protein
MTRLINYFKKYIENVFVNRVTSVDVRRLIKSEAIKRTTEHNKLFYTIKKKH